MNTLYHMHYAVCDLEYYRMLCSDLNRFRSLSPATRSDSDRSMLLAVLHPTATVVLELDREPRVEVILHQCEWLVELRWLVHMVRCSAKGG